MKRSELRKIIREEVRKVARAMKKFKTSKLFEADSKIYIPKGQKAPKGKKLQTGPRGGQYFTGSAADKQSFEKKKNVSVGKPVAKIASKKTSSSKQAFGSQQIKNKVAANYNDYYKQGFNSKSGQNLDDGQVEFLKNKGIKIKAKSIPGNYSVDNPDNVAKLITNFDEKIRKNNEKKYLKTAKKPSKESDKKVNDAFKNTYGNAWHKNKLANYLDRRNKKGIETKIDKVYWTGSKDKSVYEPGVSRYLVATITSDGQKRRGFYDSFYGQWKFNSAKKQSKK